MDGRTSPHRLNLKVEATSEALYTILGNYLFIDDIVNQISHRRKHPPRIQSQRSVFTVSPLYKAEGLVVVA
ncbi:hypothetical protein N7456_001772 [Penicillium angulare]|uniref:Uncharacterized protein n=1 Tax=Penicillium angulare TaxID=116970 RepID=A0A9W9G7C4_9EURO|nr:hypothetical protein N7456_001772 [Penicillium angulare]